MSWRSIVMTVATLALAVIGAGCTEAVTGGPLEGADAVDVDADAGTLPPADARPDVPPMADAPPPLIDPETSFPDSTGQGHPTATIQSPANYASTASSPRPLLVVLGPYGGGTGESAQNHLGWHDLKDVDPIGVLILPLTGRTDSQGGAYWNADPSAADRDGTGNDDATYVRAMIDGVLAAGWNVDLSRVFVVGVSNGGFMAQAMAAKHSDRVTAIIDVAGSGRTVAPLIGGQPVHALIDHSEGDQSVRFGGGSAFGLPPYLGTLDALAQRASQNGSTGLYLETAGAFDHDVDVLGNETDRYVYSTNAGAVTEHWREATSKHNFDGTPVAGTIRTTWGRDAWAWLVAHPR